MRLYSTRKNAPVVSFHDALFRGQAPDGGLYIPEKFPVLDTTILASFAGKDYKEIAYYVLSQLLADEFTSEGLVDVIQDAYSFAPGLVHLDAITNTLELFHGPTLSFKDFGARFMAKSMGYFIRKKNREITILVATSGDTGSAVAHAYHHIDGIRIVLLYPSGKVSRLQEKQLTTIGDNIIALEVEGAFDDCQALVKRAFNDQQLGENLTLSSANSINIGRLVPQSIYYFWAVFQMIATHGDNVLVCVPSGNFGNLCAGLFANQMGLPVKHYIAAVNANAVVSEYIETGAYKPRPSIRTLSNAMDVGNPSNWERIRELYKDDYQTISERIWSTSVSDDKTVEAMQRTFAECQYIADPHTSVGLEALRRYRRICSENAHTPAIVLSTAHPGKFQETVHEALGIDIALPAALQESLTKEKQTIKMRNRYDDFKDFLWQLS
ncbi:threonine synthase [candidate division KSB1 bacterium]|nr:threonine synthase [candidate division KSB1 bacterium]RQW00894.1 MAG: threonine synthase [candidate division KSB1 bacterium]